MKEALPASFIASCFTGLGAIPVLISEKISHKVYDTLLGFSAGIMIATVCFNLIEPSTRIGSLGQTITGIISAAAFLFLMEKSILPFGLAFAGFIMLLLLNAVMG